jgi:selenide,water dikinase
MASADDITEAKNLMKQLNKSGAEVMKKYCISGATDITGFGLSGHALKMAKASNITIKFNMKKVPLIGNVYNLVEDGCIPGASFRNLDFVEESLYSFPDLDYNLKMISFDAQTSGGLLMSVASPMAEAVLTDLHNAGLTSAAIIGEVIELQDKHIQLQN